MDAPPAARGTASGATAPRRARLADFASFLRAHGVLPRAQEYSFAQQDTLQKCAFIAQEGFGLDLGYEWHLHEYGAFSSSLAADYCGLVEQNVRPGEDLTLPKSRPRA